MVAIAVMNTRAARRAVVAPEPRLPSGVRLVLGVTGLAELVVAAGLFVLPSQVGDLWPWAVTPLTARTLAAVVTAGLIGISRSAGRGPASRRLLEQGNGFMFRIGAKRFRRS